MFICNLVENKFSIRKLIRCNSNFNIEKKNEEKNKQTNKTQVIRWISFVISHLFCIFFFVLFVELVNSLAVYKVDERKRSIIY